jgi:uncharacterized protein
LTRATRFNAGTIRTFMEVIVAIVGYFLGGPLGVGTAIFALSLGLFMEFGFFLVNRFKKTQVFRLFWFG